MNVHVLQHAAFEGLGNMAAWLDARGARISTSHLYASPALPEIAALDQIDLLIALGGPMSVNDEVALPWLAPERRLIGAAIERGVAVLGVCLGAQLIAASQGMKVYPGREKEIGWHPLQGVAHGADALRFPDTAEVFHWHGETFDLPHGAVQLARTEACENQAFQLGARTIGLQFHLEVTRESVAAMLEHGQADLVDGRHVQTDAQMRAAPERHYAGVRTLMHALLDRLVA